MKKSFLYLTIALLVFGIALWQNNAQAQCRYRQSNGVTIVPDVTTLEITGGNIFDGLTPLPGSDTPHITHDVFIRLDQENPNSLGVSIINQATLEVQSSSIPVEPFAFGFADRIINTADGSLGTVIITDGDFGVGGGTLTYLWSADGTNWTQAPVGLPNQYANAVIINTGNNDFFGNNQFSNDFAILGLNAATNGIDAYQTADGGHNWNSLGQLVNPPVVSPFDGGVACTGTSDGHGGFNLLYGRDTGANNMDVILGNTTTGFEQVVDTDTWNDGILRDGTAAQNGDWNAATVYNGNWNSFHATTWDNTFGQPGGAPAETSELGPASNFNDPGQLGFTSAASSRTPQNNQNAQIGIVSPGGKTWHISFGEGGQGAVVVTQSPPNQDPTRLTQSGPVAMTQINNAVVGNSVSYYRLDNSFEYAQCVFISSKPIPTLSEWGLIAMVGVLGIAGLLAVRRRKLAV